jgi:uncharacterized membrane protein
MPFSVKLLAVLGCGLIARVFFGFRALIMWNTGCRQDTGTIARQLQQGQAQRYLQVQEFFGHFLTLCNPLKS